MYKIEFKNVVEIVEDEKILKKVFDDLVDMLKSNYNIHNDIVGINMDFLNTQGVEACFILFEKYDGTVHDEHISITRILPISEENYEDRIKDFLQDVYSSI